MPVRSRGVMVDTQPTALTTGSDQDFNPNYRDVAVSNTSDVTIYLGGPDVTPANGFPLAPGGALSFDQVSADAIPYGIVEGSAVEVAVLELGV